MNEPTRARYPDEQGYVERDGVRIFWESYGDGERTLLLMPPWSIAHSRAWKAQIPYLARHWRVVCFDGRGSGKSDRPRDPEAHGLFEYRDDAIAVMNATGCRRVGLVAASMGSLWGLFVAAKDPRVECAVLIASSCPVRGPWPDWTEVPFREPLESYEGWSAFNVNHWREDYRGFVEHWMAANVVEPHSARVLESAIELGLDTDAETLIATLGPEIGARTMRAVFAPLADILPPIAGSLNRPVLVIHGRLDPMTPHHWGEALAEATGGELLTIEGAGHFVGSRHPVVINLAINDFATRHMPARARAQAAN